MSGATRGQRVRLGIFLLVAFIALGGTLISMVGLKAFERRDLYFVFIEGSVSGLSPGSPVKLNGIDVGRVDAVRIDPDKPTGVEVTISLKPGTPVKEDTVAVLNFQGITGLKFIELSGGTADAHALAPGGRIASSRSMVDLLTDKATSIATKVEKLLDHLVRVTSGENAELVTKILFEVQTIATSTRLLLADNRAPIKALIANLDKAVTDARTLLKDGRQTLAVAQTAVTRASNWVDPSDVSRVVQMSERAVRRFEKAIHVAESTLNATTAAMKTARARLSKPELGATIAGITELAKRSTRLVDRADVTLLRARDDILRALDVLVDGAENFAEFAAILRDNPSALIRGSQAKERKLP